MTWKPTSPDSRPVPVKQTKSIDRMRIEAAEFHFPPTGSPVMRVTWSEGYMSGGNYKKAETKVADCMGPDVVAALAKAPAQTTRRRELDKLIFEVLRACDEVPAGTWLTAL